MKFRASFTGKGLKTLEKGLLPALEKFGKKCEVLLGPEDIHLIQSPPNTDGMHIAARWAKDVLFAGDSYIIVSRHLNLIAFEVDVTLLLRVLRAVGAIDADTLEIKLAMRQVPAPGGEESIAKPFLTFSCAGAALHMVHDLPITKPYPAADIDRLMQEKDITTLCPFYLDIAADSGQVQAMVDKFGRLGSALILVASRTGDLHLQVSGTAMHMGVELRGLRVLPQDAAINSWELRHASPEGRMQEALDAGHALSVLCGVDANKGHVHFMFVYCDPDSRGGYDDSISLSYKLPVRED